MKTEFFISWRYLATKKKEKFISLISIISILGVAIGVMALIVVLSVMTGFDRDLHEKIVGNYSDIIVSGYGTIDAASYETIKIKILASSHVRGLSPSVQGQVVIKQGERFFAVGLKGIDPKTEAQVTRIHTYLIQGNLSEVQQGEIIVGKELAGLLGLGLKSFLTVYSPQGKEFRLKVVGVFNSGMYDYDLNLAFTHYKTAQDIFGMPGQFSSIAVKLDNHYKAAEIKDALQKALGVEYVLKTWMEVNRNFFAALKLEKLTMFIILTLIILVASFNIISTLIVMVVEKTKDIGILKALGMTAGNIRSIFIYEGLIIGVCGVFFGVMGGVALCTLLKKYQFVKLPQDVYYIDHLPVSIQWWPDIIVIVAAAMAIALVSTIYPALKASRLNPVEALRYE